MGKAATVVMGIVVFFLSTFTSPQAMNGIQFYDLANGRLLPENDFASRMADHRFVLVGERHNMASHHRAQLEVVKLLVDNGKAVAIGMEMMRSDSQGFLDAWVAGRLEEDEFKTIYLDNWNFPWELYRPIFRFARDHRIPIVGLNVPRAITRQVAREGFDSLSPDQRQGLPFVTCRIDDDYMAYIREAYGAHGHGNMSFNNFCEAQLVWDKAMAVKAFQYTQKEPDRLMVILAGTGHARKGGIPSQLIALGNRSFQVVLPEIPDILSPETLDSRDADILIRGL